MTGPATRPPNRLARETSPYLLQHAHNPVDWYPWGDEAFARAVREEKPVFLSIGYSTCHWCHVMERESFENDAVAELLNAHFVCVKVDREERPDVDRLYMTASQAMGTGGGWPLNVFLTPERLPFFGGTYFPPVTRQGRVGLTELLPRVHAAWLEQQDAIRDGGARVVEAVRSLAAVDAEAAPADTLARECAKWLERSHDAHEGGFGTAPKFPSPGNLAFLFRWWARDPARRADALAMALGQLDAMARGGIHDHVGGGFHRYATDREWLVPHFEKMLYDQALILDAYVDGYEATANAGYADVARGIVAYLRRDLAAPGGAFFAAEDADAEGEEGRFHVWTPAQLEGVLGADEAAWVAHHFDVTPRGNFEHGASVLSAPRPLAETAQRFGLDPADAAARLERAKAALLAVRETRPRPHRDEKVLASWNGLAIAALARAGRVLGDASMIADAARAAAFVWDALRGPDGALRRHWSAGAAAGEGQLDDHAYVARGLVGLWASTHDAAWLAKAAELTRAMIARFADPAEGGGGFFDSPDADPASPAGVLVRMKDGFDGAELAGNSVAALNLARLDALQPGGEWSVPLARTVDYHARRLAGAPWAMPVMLVAMEAAAHPARHVVIAGEASPERDALLAVARRGFRPFDDVVVVDEGSRAALAPLAPFAASLHPRDGRATAYVCVDRACRLPVTEPDALAEQLKESAS